MITAVYAGSFDPITLGHLDVLEQSTKVFDKVIVAIAYNPEKRGFLPVEKRIELIKICTKGFKNLEISAFDGLTVEFAKNNNASVLIRGLRNSLDFEYENRLAQINSKLDSSIRTVFFAAKPEYSAISSSAVRELITHNHSLEGFVPECAVEYLMTNAD